MYSFIVVKFVNRKIHSRENWLIFLGIWVEPGLILRIRGAKTKYFQGTEEFSIRDLGRSKSEYDQEIPQSHNADQPKAPLGRATEHLQ